MIPRVILSAFVAFLLSFPAFAQSTGSIAGKVLDPDGNPVNGAAVEVLKTNPRLGSYSRADGSYHVRRIIPGAYQIRVSAPGFESDTVEVVFKGPAVASLGITLKPTSVVERLGHDGPSEGVAARGGGARLEAADVAYAPLATDGASGGTTMAMRMAPSGVAAEHGSSTEVTLSATSRDPGVPGVPDTTQPAPRPGQLTAAEWNDLGNWPYWNEVIGLDEWKAMPSHWGYEPSTRISIIVHDGERLVADAEVMLKEGQGGTIWRARTDNRGRAELFAGIAGRSGSGYRVEVKSGEAFGALDNVAAPSNGQLAVKLRNPVAAPRNVDLMFVIDCTGSMGDELEYVKSELESVIDRARDNMPGDLPMRMSANFYRDHGDEYIVRSFPFTESTFEAIGWIRDQRAENGGDFEEAVEEALDDAINKHEWSPTARARLLFLVLDAPPHYTTERLAKLHELSLAAAAKGIRIIPVASSGINKETEFLLRLLGMYSGGTYTFLTDDSGIGQSHLKPTVGDHRIEYLDDLMVRLIGEWTNEGTITEELRARLR